MSEYLPILCPCCSKPAEVPTIEMVIDQCLISDFQARILREVWAGKGHPVATPRIIWKLYEDDEDGGPEDAKAYEYFKQALGRLRVKLAGTGIDIENCGYRRGWRLVIRDKAAA